MSTYSKYDKAIGSWRANKPLWPGINGCQLKRPDIRMQSCHVCHSSLLANEGESIYGHDYMTIMQWPMDRLRHELQEPAVRPVFK